MTLAATGMEPISFSIDALDKDPNIPKRTVR